LIVKGGTDKDFGKMRLVVRQTKSMVAATGATKEKQRRPGSLIQLEEGLVAEQDVDGVIWIVPRDGA
jgi:hypothetical protein